MKKTVPEDHQSFKKSQENISKHTRMEGSETQPLTSSERIIAGFLVSFSGNPSGEYWPLYEGRNRIGSAKANDVVINDSNASSEHAILNIRHSVNDGRLLVAISDQNSSNGTIVNKKDIEFTTCELQNEDIIQIGNHEFAILFVDREQKGLSPSEELQPSSSQRSSYTSPYDVSVKSSSSKKTKPE